MRILSRKSGPTFASVLIISAFLLELCILIPPTFADDNDDNIGDDLDQDVKQKQKCKIGVFSDPEESASSTVLGLCNQQAQNNVHSDTSLGGIGISTGGQ